MDSSWDGGNVEVYVSRGVSDCPLDPADDSGVAVSFDHGSTVGAGPLTLTPQDSGLVALLTLWPGPNSVCAWLVDNNGLVLAEQGAVAVAKSNPLVSHWNTATAACRSLRSAEVARALDLGGAVMHRNGGAWDGTGLSEFEHDYGSYCAWEAQSAPWSAVLYLWPEPTRPTLARAIYAYRQTASFTLLRGPCRRLGGVRAPACTYSGADGYGAALAAEGHLIVDLAIEAPPKDTAARIRAQEKLLVSRILARVAMAHG